MVLIYLGMHSGQIAPLSRVNVKGRMCIALISTAHPEYPFILINNRDVG